MNWQRPIRFDPREGVDRKDLKILCRRFLEVNAGRLARTRALLSARQSRVLEVLPLLFQTNHPMLPGYVSRDVPRGIHGYEPGPEDIRAAQQLSRSFAYRHEPKGPTDIRALFLMGSTGSIAHGPQSDFDIWLCHRSSLSARERQLLSEKAERVSTWATSQGVETHIFLIDAAEFRALRKQAEANKEDCGTAQHFLLLDEFYRTHLWLAGAYPLWWIIPAGQEAHFNDVARTLVQKRFIKSRDYIDFGGCPKIPPAEFVGAGMWQLYKGLDAPYKSVLKLLLIEAYAREGEAGRALCLDYKEQIFEGKLDIDQLDPYVMIYRRLESRFGGDEFEQTLALARRAFYLKVGEALSPGPARTDSWRRVLLRELVTEWEWSGDTLKFLDRRPQWKFEAVRQERRAVMEVLTGAYRFLSRFATEQRIESAISARDLNLLGRKLYAVFQRKAGKLDWVNPGIAPDISEDHLALVHSSEWEMSTENAWYLFRRVPVPTEPVPTPLRKSNGLFGLLAWAHLNGLWVSRTTLALQPGTTAGRLYEVQQLMQELDRALPLPLPVVTQPDYEAPAIIRQALLVVNVGLDPLQMLTERGLAKLSDKTDPMRFGDEQVNLVQQLDLLIRNSWNEVVVQHFSGESPLIQCLKALLGLLFDAFEQGHTPALTVACHCAVRAQAIRERIQALCEALQSAYFGPEGSLATRYVLEVGGRYAVFQFANRQPRVGVFAQRAELFEYLGQPQSEPSGIVVDANALRGDPVRAIARQTSGGPVAVFYADYGSELELLITDEQGSLHYQLGHAGDLQQYLAALHRFLTAVQRRLQMRDLLEDSGAEQPASLYRLQPANQELRAIPEKWPATSRSLDAPEILVLGESVGEKGLVARAWVDEREFLIQSGDVDSLAELAVYLKGRYRPGATLRAYITDLSLPEGWVDDSAGQKRQTIHYLRLRQRLEQDLMQALQRV